MTKSKDNLIWIDCEMTGLSPEHNRIIEIATVITNSQLDIVAEGPVLAIHQPDDHLALMDEWNTQHHTASGLVERVRASQVDAQDAEQQTLAFLSQYVDAGDSPMCGNSICMDRRFLHRYMPNLEKYFHYRHVDVSTIKELARRWAPAVYDKVQKTSKHLALDDIKESIDELKYYREVFFIENQ